MVSFIQHTPNIEKVQNRRLLIGNREMDILNRKRIERWMEQNGGIAKVMCCKHVLTKIKKKKTRQ